MKKRIISLLLCAVLLLALCPAVFAADNDYAAFYLTEYKVQSGDTLTSICESRGIKYADYASVIKNVNGISNPNKLVAGRTYWIPTRSLGECDRYYTVYRHVLVKGDTVSALCSSYGVKLNSVSTLIQNLNGVSSLTNFAVGVGIYLPVPGGSLAEEAAAPTPTAAPASGSATAGASTVKAKSGDYAAFYITPYVCQRGDTLSSICKARGVAYASYKKMILSLNKLASETALIAGRSYWMPGSSVGSATVYYTVYSHLVVAGDTMYALCNAYGINMNKYTDLILKLNNVKSLTGFQAGKNVLLPVYHDGGTGESGISTEEGLDETKAGVGSGTVTVQSTTDAKGNPVSVTTTTSTTVQELEGLFDATQVANYYLVPYTVSAGESLISICNDMGSSFSKNKDILVAANGLKSYTLSVGSTIYIPVPSASDAAKYYSVSVKTIKWGDTVYGYYCDANANFSVNYKMLTALNGNLNFNNLAVNSKISIPVLAG